MRTKAPGVVVVEYEAVALAEVEIEHAVRRTLTGALVSTVEAEHVGAGTPKHQIIATAAHQDVRMKAPDQDVVATLAFEEVAHRTEQIGDEQIVTVVACDEIVRCDSNIGAAI